MYYNRENALETRLVMVLERILCMECTTEFLCYIVFFALLIFSYLEHYNYENSISIL